MDLDSRNYFTLILPHHIEDAGYDCQGEYNVEEEVQEVVVVDGVILFYRPRLYSNLRFCE
jgi:hypothetical protein